MAVHNFTIPQSLAAPLGNAHTTRWQASKTHGGFFIEIHLTTGQLLSSSEVSDTDLSDERTREARFAKLAEDARAAWDAMKK